jgi:hypothetical protein
MQLDVPDSMNGMALSLENPTQLYWMILSATDPGDFQDRCSCSIVLVDLDAFLGVNAQLKGRVRNDVVVSTPFENRLHCVLRRAVPRVSRVR